MVLWKKAEGFFHDSGQQIRSDLSLAGTFPKEMKFGAMTSRIFKVGDCMLMEVESL